MDSTGDPHRKIAIIRAYTLKDLAGLYDTTKYLMRKWLSKHKKKIGKREGHYYSSEQVNMIFDLVPLPSNIKRDGMA